MANRLPLIVAAQDQKSHVGIGLHIANDALYAQTLGTHRADNVEPIRCRLREFPRETLAVYLAAEAFVLLRHQHAASAIEHRHQFHNYGSGFLQRLDGVPQAPTSIAFGRGDGLRELIMNNAQRSGARCGNSVLPHGLPHCTREGVHSLPKLRALALAVCTASR